jgi:hypothetical protein
MARNLMPYSETKYREPSNIFDKFREETKQRETTAAVAHKDVGKKLTPAGKRDGKSPCQGIMVSKPSRAGIIADNNTTST